MSKLTEIVNDVIVKVNSHTSQIDTHISVPTAYHIYNGSVETTIKANKTELTTTTTKAYANTDYIFCYADNKLYDCILASTIGTLLTNTTYFTPISAGSLAINALVPYANGIDTKGSKVSISYKNETISGLTLTQGKNYIFSKNDGTYGSNKYAPMYGSLRNRSVPGENPDYFDLKTLKWYSTTGGSELVTNGTFDSNTNGWTAQATIVSSVENGRLKIVTNSSNNAVYQSITVKSNTKYKVKLSAEGNSNQILIGSGIKTGTIIDVSSFASGWTFTNNEFEFNSGDNTTLYICLYCSNAGAYTIYFDNISVFEAEPTLSSAITPRNYLDAIVYADGTGNATYVEQLHKTTYFDEIKANEYKGKNACTAWVNFDGTTTPPTIRDSYNVSSVVRTATGMFDVYFATAMDNVNYVASSNAQNTYYGATDSFFLNKCRFISRGDNNTATNISNNNIIFFGGKD